MLSFQFVSPKLIKTYYIGGGTPISRKDARVNYSNQDYRDQPDSLLHAKENSKVNLGE